MVRVVLFVISAVLIVSCGSTPSSQQSSTSNSTTSNRTTQPGKPIDQEQNLIVQSEILAPISGKPVEDTVELGPETGPIFIKDGKAIRLDLVDFDPLKHRIQTTLGNEPGMVRLEVIDIDEGTVKLENKCQVVNVYGFGEIPQVRLPAGATPEQVVVTPIVNERCEIYGYQIRYGSEERGCKQVAKEVLKRFQKCFSKTTANKKKPGAPDDKAVKASNNKEATDLDCVLFGDCK